MDIIDQEQLPIVEKEKQPIDSLQLVYTLFGNTREPEYYQRRLQEVQETFNLEFYEDVPTEVKGQIVQYPTNHFEHWDQIKNLLSDQTFDELTIGQILNHIAHYDLRISLALLHSLGLTNQVYFQPSFDFVKTYAEVGLQKLFDDLEAGEVFQRNFRQNNKTRFLNFITKLENICLEDLIVFDTGRLIGLSSLAYSLAILFIEKGDSLDTSKFTKNQLYIFNRFTSKYHSNGTFVSLFAIAEELGIVYDSVLKNFQEILDKLNTDKLYSQLANGKVCEIDPNGVMYRLISLYNQNPLLLESKYLKDVQLGFIKLILKPTPEGFYPSLRDIAKRSNMSVVSLIYSLEDSLERLDPNSNVFYTKDREKIIEENMRLKLIGLEADEQLLVRLKPLYRQVLQLLTRREDRILTYSYLEVAEALGIIENSARRIANKILHIAEGNIPKVLDHDYKPIIKNHRKLIEVYLSKGADYLNQFIVERDRYLIHALVTPSSEGRYAGYKALAQQLGTKHYLIQFAVARTLKAIEATES